MSEQEEVKETKSDEEEAKEEEEKAETVVEEVSEAVVLEDKGAILIKVEKPLSVEERTKKMIFEDVGIIELGKREDFNYNHSVRVVPEEANGDKKAKLIAVGTRKEDLDRLERVVKARPMDVILRKVIVPKEKEADVIADYEDLVKGLRSLEEIAKGLKEAEEGA